MVTFTLENLIDSLNAPITVFKKKSSSLSSSSRTKSKKKLWKHLKRRVRQNELLQTSLIVNFPHLNCVDESIIRRNLEVFAPIRSIVLCTIDKCQAFVTFHANKSTENCRKINEIMEITNHSLVVDDKVWSLSYIDQCSKCCSLSQFPHNPAAENQVSVQNLQEIFDNYWQKNCSISQTSLTSSTTNHSSIKGRKESILSTKSVANKCVPSILSIDCSSIPSHQQSTGFLPLAPPYHILPDTPYFRKALIIPPPQSTSNLSILQLIINRYLDSMQIDDEYSNSDFCSTIIDFCDERTIREEYENISKIFKCPWWNI